MQSFCAVSLVTSTLLEFASLLLLNRFGLNVLPSGPIPLVFSILYQYFRLVPEAYHFRILGVTLSDKFWVYGTALQVRLHFYQRMGFMSEIHA